MSKDKGMDYIQRAKREVEKFKKKKRRWWWP